MSPNTSEKRPGTLLTLLTGKKEDLDLVRRRVGYNRLILLSHPGTEDLAESVRRRESDAVVRVDPLPRGDAMTQLETIRAVVKRETRASRGKARIVLNAAGGDPESVLAMLLLAYEEGHETWFTQEGQHERLPILSGVKIRSRLEKDEESVLRALPAEGKTSSELAQRIILNRDRIEAAFRSLEKKDLVALYPQDGRVAARPSSTGRYLQGHLGRNPSAPIPSSGPR